MPLLKGYISEEEKQAKELIKALLEALSSDPPNDNIVEEPIIVPCPPRVRELFDQYPTLMVQHYCDELSQRGFVDVSAPLHLLIAVGVGLSGIHNWLLVAQHDEELLTRHRNPNRAVQTILFGLLREKPSVWSLRIA